MIKGWKKLSKFERSHLSEMKCNHTMLFQSTIDEQAKRDRNSEVVCCWDCRAIARKLGMEPDGGWE